MSYGRATRTRDGDGARRQPSTPCVEVDAGAGGGILGLLDRCLLLGGLCGSTGESRGRASTRNVDHAARHGLLLGRRLRGGTSEWGTMRLAAAASRAEPSSGRGRTTTPRRGASLRRRRRGPDALVDATGRHRWIGRRRAPSWPAWPSRPASSRPACSPSRARRPSRARQPPSWARQRL